MCSSPTATRTILVVPRFRGLDNARAYGMNMDEIATALGVSKRTVTSYLGA
jgi:AcrR family transcriptional regulator